MGDWTLDLSGIPDDAAPLTGTKALNLGRLARSGLRVPPGFVITTEAYRQREVAAEAVEEAILAAYRQFGAGEVAVRSSASAEDLEARSFAGQQDTFLNVEGEAAVLEAVRRCWTSLFGERAVEYRRASGVSDEGLAMAVIVQRQVASEVSGVLFTRDPLALDDGAMLVEAAPGLGEAVVSGRVTPDRWRLHRDTGETLRAQAAAAAAPCLTEAELRALAETGRKIEALFGAPQDIEWARAGGDISLLQSRPITAGGGDAKRLREEEISRLRSRAEAGGTVWARYSLAEVLPEPLPLTWAYWRQFMSAGGGYGTMYRELGYDPDPELETDGVLDLIAGRVYFNLSRDRKMYFREMPYDYPFAKLKADPSLAVYPVAEVNLAIASRGFLLRLPGLTRKVLTAEKVLSRAEEEIPQRLERDVYPRMIQFATELRARDLGTLTDAELLRSIEETRRFLFDEFLPQALKPSLLGGLCVQRLRLELERAFGSEAGRTRADELLMGVAPAPEADLAGGLRKLASGALAEDEFLERFGHRGPGEMELANPRWREIETSLGVAFGGAPPIDCAQSQQDLPGKKAVQYLERARRMISLREASKHYLMLGYEGLRRLLLELGRRSELGDGVFFLEPAELRLPGSDELIPLIAARRRRRAFALGLTVPRVLFSDDLEAIGRSALVEFGDGWNGTGVSAGTREGPALVLRSPAEAPAGARDFVLVCPSTDPGWVPLFLRARAVVLETGGVLSHGAIVARELGLPAVANIEDACLRIRDGQRLRVDGGTGRVTLLAENREGE